MNKLVSMVVLVACLVGLASGGLFGSKKRHSSKEVDFEGLGAFLVKKLKDNNDSGDNFAFIKKNMEKMTDGERKAAEILQQLKASTKSCNDETIEVLSTAVQTGLTKMFVSTRGKGERRIDAIIKTDLENVIRVCEPYIDKQLAAKVSSADSKMEEFLERMRPSYTVWDAQWMGTPTVYDMERTESNYIYCVSNNYKLANKKQFETTQEINEEQLDRFLNDLAARGGESSEYFAKPVEKAIRKGNRANFEAGFKKYLVEPCKRFAAHFEPLFDGVHAIASLINKFEYVKHRNVQFRQLAYTNKACQAVLILDENNDSQGKLGFNKGDMLESMVDWPQGYHRYYWGDSSDSDSDSDSEDE